jgi:hypothetical protein
VWIMVPAAIVDSVIAELRPRLKAGDVLIDGGNSHYQDDIRRAEALQPAGRRSQPARARLEPLRRWAICTAARMAPVTSSRWYITASSTA